jgi:Asp-tRNA(Asn)/Glu-tRNA(Gln) amidotransferase A subunit family amidase
MTLDRRSFLTACSRAGITSALMPGVLYTLAAQAQDATGNDQLKPPVFTPEMIDQAALIAGVGPFSDEQKKMMIDGLTDVNGSMKAIRKLNIPNSVAPAFVFRPLAAGQTFGIAPGNFLQLKPWSESLDLDEAGKAAAAPARIEDLAFANVRELATLLKGRKISALELTKMYLDRLKRHDKTLHFSITLTEERALKQAAAADAEIAAGKYRGPLHGIPWGAKDLLAVKGYPTTWGAGGFEHQEIDEDATVVQRLDKAGAILVAKLTLGALAMGDKWFGGKTRNPWNPKQGSSGSSAGPASAVAAGCVVFAIGSETLGSISSPCTRCGCSGLRPTFGLVPRTGAMALSWTMDKLGPICRSAEDCALVLDAIRGPDNKDAAVIDIVYDTWTPAYDSPRWIRLLRVGYLKSAFDEPSPFKDPEAAANETPDAKKKREEQTARMREGRARRDYDRRFDLAVLDKLKEMGVKLIPVELPKLPYGAMTPLLGAEGAAAFDDLTRSGRDKLLTEQGADDWPNEFRMARFYPAVEYIQANRARTLAVQQVSALFEQVDIIVAPTNGPQLAATNLTGHPALIVPNGLRGADAPHPAAMDSGEEDDVAGPNTPVSITFLAGHYEDAKLAAFGRAYQLATGFHKLHPRL